MLAYIVSYDLSKEEYYDNLYSKLEQYESLNILKSVWVIITDDAIQKIKSNLIAGIPEKDRSTLKLVIIKLSRMPENLKELNLDNNTIEWLNKNFFLNIKDVKDKISKIKNLSN